jgi:DNA excision repair protein ERCC-3
MPPKRKSHKYDEDDEEEYVEESTHRFVKGSSKGVTRGRKKGTQSSSHITVDQVEEDEVDEVNFLDYSDIPLKKDHLARPIWISPNGVIILEAFSPLYQQAYDFLVAIAEPISRPTHVHRYLLTPYSLYAAVAVSIDTNSIIDVLGRLCKTEVPRTVVDFIRSSTATFGKARLVLKDNKFYVESSYPDVLRLLLKHSVIAEARVLDDPSAAQHADGFTRSAALKELDANLSFTKIGKSEKELLTSSVGDEGDDDVDDLDESAAAGQEAQQTVSFMVHQDKVQVCFLLCCYLPSLQ